MAAAAGVLLVRPRPRASGTPPASTPPTAPAGARRAAVAVLGFANLGHEPETAWLSVALAEMMTADLAAGERLRLVSATDAARLNESLPARPGALSREALAAAHDQLDADFVVRGSYLTLSSPDGELLRVDVMLQNTSSGEIILTVSRTGAAHRLFTVVDEAAAGLRFHLGVEAPPAPVTAAAKAWCRTAPMQRASMLRASPDCGATTHSARSRCSRVPGTQVF